MRKARSAISLLLSLALILPFCPQKASAAGDGGMGRYGAAAEALWEEGLFLGTGTSFELDKPLTRAAGTTMVVRILGAEAEALAGSWSTLFTDVPDWAAPYVGYAYANGIVQGTSSTTFSPNSEMSATQYLTLLLRALGYDDSAGDFSWDRATDKAMELGLAEKRDISGQFLRGQAALFAYNALRQNVKGTSTILRSTIQVPGHPSGKMPSWTAPVMEELSEITKARELGLIPAEWEADLAADADFAGFHQLMTALITLCDKPALSAWNQSVHSAAFPRRNMLRDDGLVLLMLGAEALGYNVYNAREYGFCTENYVDYEAMFSQFSWDYPYCDTQREIPIYFDFVGGSEDPIGNVGVSAVFWMQRRMDIYQRVHFLDHDEDLNFHFDQSLTREAAAAAVIRLYNSEMLEYDPLVGRREATEEDRAILSTAETVKQDILNNMDELPCEGTAYYVSNNGSDRNNGLTPETAWATLDHVNAANLRRGDGVYFERGGLWRGQLWAQEGVIYSAYGAGEKPRIYASPENGADPSKWSLLEGTSNIWVYHMDMMDCGILVFNDGDYWGVKVAPYYVNGYRSTIHEGQPFDVKTELTEDLMFFSEADSILYDGAPFRYTVMDTCDRGEYPEEVVGTLYLRCDKGNPGEVFSSIEFAVRQNIILPADGTVFHNLCLRYTGAHGIFGGDIGYDVLFCEIGWIGGSPQYYRYDNGKPELLGNGVECDGSYDHYSVTDCYIYQCYDAGVSNQDPAELPEVTGTESGEFRDVIQRNITYAGNVFAYNDMPIEIFFTLEDDAGYGRHRMENVLIEDNYFLYTGYGWASVRNNKAQHSSAYMGHNHPNASENFRIVNNVFYLSTGPLLSTGAPEKWQPELDGNIYVQNDGGILAAWSHEGGYQASYAYYYNSHQDTVTEVIRDVLGDEHGIALSN